MPLGVSPRGCRDRVPSRSGGAPGPGTSSDLEPLLEACADSSPESWACCLQLFQTHRNMAWGRGALRVWVRQMESGRAGLHFRPSQAGLWASSSLFSTPTCYPGARMPSIAGNKAEAGSQRRPCSLSLKRPLFP